MYIAKTYMCISTASLHLLVNVSLSPCPPPPLQVEVTQKVISGVYSGVTTVELDTLAAETAASMTTKHPDYAILAARIAVSNLHKETKKIFSGELVFLYRLTHSLLHSTHNLTHSLTPLPLQL